MRIYNIGETLVSRKEDLSIFDLKISEEAKQIAAKYGYLPYMIERYMMLFGSREELFDFLDSVEKGIKRTLRCNTLVLNDCNVLTTRLGQKGVFLQKISWLPHGFFVMEGEEKVGKLEEYLFGYYYIQRQGSMLASYVLSPRKGEIVADLASAPGGKTTHLAQIMNNTGIIFSIEKNPVRARSLIANIQRMRVINSVVIVKDILSLSFSSFFDKALLDAPCTGEGLLPILRERKTSKTIEDLMIMSELQVKLLNKALDMVSPGGTLLYSTCSIAPEENEFVIHKVLGERDDFSIISTRWHNVGSPGLEEFNKVVFTSEMRKCLRLYPHKDGSEGFFLCLLRRE